MEATHWHTRASLYKYKIFRDKIISVSNNEDVRICFRVTIPKCTLVDSNFFSSMNVIFNATNVPIYIQQEGTRQTKSKRRRSSSLTFQDQKKKEWDSPCSLLPKPHCITWSRTMFLLVNFSYWSVWTKSRSPGFIDERQDSSLEEPFIYASRIIYIRRIRELELIMQQPPANINIC